MTIAQSPSPVPFILKRAGGAIIVADMSIWSGVGTADEKRVALLTFTKAMQEEERIDESLPPGDYQCVMRVIVREDLRGDYTVRVLAGATQVGFDTGDVNTDPNTPGQGIAFPFTFGLRVV